jgi:hypothetical protein
MANDQVTSTKAFIDDEVARSFASMYPNLLAAYAQAVAFGDTIAIRTAAKFADRYPGDATTKPVDIRAYADGVLQAQAYLLTMVSSAAVAGNQTELSAASDAVAANTSSLSALFRTAFGSASAIQAGRVWSDEQMLVTAYAKSGDPASRQNAIAAALPPLGNPSGTRPPLTTAITALLQAVDDQRSKAYSQLADDDRAAAVQLMAIGDALTGA